MRVTTLVLGIVLTIGILVAVVQAVLMRRGSHSIVSRAVNRSVSKIWLELVGGAFGC